MNKISCNTCLDLMPLVIDGVSSEDSSKLVEDHIKECKECRSIYSEPKLVETEELEIDDDRVLGKIKRKLYSFAALILILGSIIGASLNNSQNIFYNFLIMPLLGGVSYIAFGKRAYLGSIFVFIISFINQSINSYLTGYFSNMGDVFFDAFSMTIEFMIFFFLGILIFKLFHFSIYGGKEDKNEK